MMQESKTLFVH